ncbi:MAG: GAF domain-containing protein [Promethearchaeota archaeon]|jgi:GAF domain-containing protein
MAKILKKRFNEDEILDKISKLADDPENIIEKTVNILKDVSHYHWIGIYLVEDDTLVLRYYIGKPTEHTRIKIGSGICGAAVAEERIIVVSDVKSDDRYIACSAETRSEIVVPIWSSHKIIGEIDIDSDIPDAFNFEDEHMLKQIANILGDHI